MADPAETIRHQGETYTRIPYPGTYMGENAVLKVETSPSANRYNSFDRVLEIVTRMRDARLVCVPEVLEIGVLKNGRRFFLSGRIRPKPGGTGADIILAAMEMKSLGYLHGDLSRSDNHIFDGRIAYLIDYDQTFYDAAYKEMPFFETVTHAAANDTTHRLPWRQCLPWRRQLAKWGYRGQRLDLAHTTLFRKEVSTATATGIYHHVDLPDLFVKGERGISARAGILDRLDFKGERVLDIGSNTGALSRYIKSRGADCCDGFEISPEASDAANILAHLCGDFASRSHVRDLGVQPVPPGRYHTICAFSVIHHVKNFPAGCRHLNESGAGRILLEARLYEQGYCYERNASKTWISAHQWRYGSPREMADDLCRRHFGNYAPGQILGQVDRGRLILQLVKRT